MKRHATPPHLLFAAALTVSLAACAPQAQPAGSPDSPSAASSRPQAGATGESSARTPRLAYTHDGGVTVIDASSGRVESTFALTGFTRLNPAGDARHLLVTEQDTFRLLDLGSWTKRHGDHRHFHVTQPSLTDVSFRGSHPGHAIVHGDRTALFFDGEGRIEWFESRKLTTTKPATTQVTLPAAHHGFALFTDDHSLIHSLGTEESRSSVVVSDQAGAQLAVNDDCPGVHGEAVAKGAVVVGCEDGVLVIQGTTITKVDADREYARSGNLAGHPDSTVVLGDRKVDKAAELERPTQVVLIDTVTKKLRTVDVGASYSFRSLAWGPKGQALVLGTDGGLRVIDPATGTITKTIGVTAAWTEPMDWQQPRPTVFVNGENVWVSEPATKQLHRVHLADGVVSASLTLDHVPNELNGVMG